MEFTPLTENRIRKAKCDESERTCHLYQHQRAVSAMATGHILDHLPIRMVLRKVASRFCDSCARSSLIESRLVGSVVDQPQYRGNNFQFPMSRAILRIVVFEALDVSPESQIKIKPKFTRSQNMAFQLDKRLEDHLMCIEDDRG